MPEQPRLEQRSHTTDAEAIAQQFFLALQRQDRRAALACCDPDWRNDSTRSAALRETLDALPPARWLFRDFYGPEHWDGRSELPWIQVEAVVTYESTPGHFETLPARLRVARTRFGWRMWNIAWWPDGRAAHAIVGEPGNPEAISPGFPASQPGPSRRSIACTRCPHTFSIPAAAGRRWAKCPKCWTGQYIDS